MNTVNNAKMNTEMRQKIGKIAEIIKQCETSGDTSKLIILSNSPVKCAETAKITTVLVWYLYLTRNRAFGGKQHKLLTGINNSKCTTTQLQVTVKQTDLERSTGGGGGGGGGDSCDGLCLWQVTETQSGCFVMTKLAPLARPHVTWKPHLQLFSLHSTRCPRCRQ